MNVPGTTALTARKKSQSRAMTLVELMVAVAAGAIILAVVAKLTLYTARSFVALSNYNDLDQKSVIAVDVMTRDIRQTKGLTAFATNQLTFTDYDGMPLVYSWNPGTLTLSRTKGAQTRVLLRQCDYLNFAIYQRNPSNSFYFYPTASLTEAKLIDVNWRCSHQILQKKVNTESVQTARIVIRN
jgi:prepilin-type N-terminal cleavage/methylation domain-containing protein